MKVLALALAISSTVALADEGNGPFPYRGKGSITAAIPRSSHNDAIRFSSAPALGGVGRIIEIHRAEKGIGIGMITTFRGHPQLGWRPVESRPIILAAGEYDALAAQVDQLLSKGEKDPKTGGDLEICTDGPGYLTERRINGRERWLSGFCGSHPNNEIARLMWRAAAEHGVSR